MNFFPPLAVLLIAVTTAAGSADADPAFHVNDPTFDLLDRYCLTCHDEDVQKGEVRLDALEDLGLDARLDLLNRMQEQVYTGEMPPRKKKAQPSESERRQLVEWMSIELERHNASKLEDKLRKFEYANYLDHEKLFSGDYAHLQGFTRDRRWLISEYIFDARFNRMLNHRPSLTIDGVRRPVVGYNNRSGISLTNPFLLPSRSGVRYYAHPSLDGGHLLTMLTNARKASEYMTDYLAARDKNYLPAFKEITALEDQHRDTLAAREELLRHFAHRLLEELYEERHAELLPKFVPVTVQEVGEEFGKEVKKAGFASANPGRDEVAAIYDTLQLVGAEGDADPLLIRKCEEHWFHYGVNQRTIRTRVTFLHGYFDEWRAQMKQHHFAERHRSPEYRPLDEAEMAVVREGLLKHRQPGDHFSQIIEKCMHEWREGFEEDLRSAGPPSSELVDALVAQLFEKVFERSPDADEAAGYRALASGYIDQLGNQPGVRKLVQTLLLSSDFMYRREFGTGEPDAHGRRMMSPQDASYAIAYALTDSGPDKQLVAAAREGRLNTRADYHREVTRLLESREQFYVIDEAVQRLNHTTSITDLPIRTHRFFREFFGYPQMLSIFKDRKRFGGDYEGSKGRLVGEADRLVEFVLKNDQHVFEELLTTDAFYVFHSGDNEAMSASSERIRRIVEYFQRFDWPEFETDDLAKHQAFLREVEMRKINPDTLGNEQGRHRALPTFKKAMTSFTARLDQGETAAAPYNAFSAHGPGNATTRTDRSMRGEEVAKFYGIQLNDWDYPTVQPAPVPHRKGMLTHPAWLIAHAHNTETDPIKRGRWIREKLLAGTVPDVPITVDAVVPEDPHNTMRTRLVAKTEQPACWKCHERMNPLGYTFEIYDDFGRFRTEEALEHPENLVKKSPDKGAIEADLRDVFKTLPVDASGFLEGTGNPELDGEVDDALELIDRLATSERVRQSIIRHAFRYFMGRNELLSDSKTLIEADRAYVESGGSFNAVVLSLLTSDSFIYRKPPPQSPPPAGHTAQLENTR